MASILHFVARHACARRGIEVQPGCHSDLTQRVVVSFAAIRPMWARIASHHLQPRIWVASRVIPRESRETRIFIGAIFIFREQGLNIGPDFAGLLESPEDRIPPPLPDADEDVDEGEGYEAVGMCYECCQ